MFGTILDLILKSLLPSTELRREDNAELYSSRIISTFCVFNRGFPMGLGIPGVLSKGGCPLPRGMPVLLGRLF